MLTTSGAGGPAVGEDYQKYCGGGPHRGRLRRWEEFINMLRYTVKRFLSMLLTLFLVATATFCLLR